MIVDDLVLAELDGLAGVLDERRDVGAEEVLAVAEADDQRRVAPRADDDAGRVGVHGEQREGALQPAADDRAWPRPGRRRSSYAAATRCAATSVSVSDSNSTPSASSSAFSAAKFSMIPLWIDGEPAVLAATVRVGVRVGRARRGSPSGCGRSPVRPGGSGSSSRASARLTSLPARFSVRQPVGGDQRHAGRVVAAVLQAAQPLQHHVERDAVLLGPA